MAQDNGFDPAKMDEWMSFIQPFAELPEDINDRWRAHLDLTGLHVAQEALGFSPNPAADLSTGQTLNANL